MMADIIVMATMRRRIFDTEKRLRDAMLNSRAGRDSGVISFEQNEKNLINKKLSSFLIVVRNFTCYQDETTTFTIPAPSTYKRPEEKSKMWSSLPKLSKIEVAHFTGPTNWHATTELPKAVWHH